MARARSGSEPRTSRGPREAPAPGSRIGAWKGKGPGRGGSVPATPLPASRRRSGNWGGAGGGKGGPAPPSHRPRTAPAPPTLGERAVPRQAGRPSADGGRGVPTSSPVRARVCAGGAGARARPDRLVSAAARPSARPELQLQARVRPPRLGEF